MSYRNDPRWLRVRFADKCRKCAAVIAPQERAYYFPLTSTAYCGRDACGPQAERDFMASAADEAML